MRHARWLPMAVPALLLACTDATPIAVGDDALANASGAAHAERFPAKIPLPNGFQPEGITIGRGTTFYVGSLAGPYMGAIYRGDLRTGKGSILVAPNPGVRQAVGLGHDMRTNLLFVAGGLFGVLNVYDGESGRQLAAYTSPALGLSNDLTITTRAVYLTDSFRPVLYRVPLGPGGRLPAHNVVEEIPLSGEYVFDPGVPFGINNNGIVSTADGGTLIIVNYGTGLLYRVDPATGHAKQIDVGGPLPNADGLVLVGRTLYAVQNFLNQIAVVELAPDYASGHIVRYITDPAFRIPTTAAAFHNWLYVVNARFDVASPFEPNPDIMEIDFDVVRVAR